MEGNIEDVKDAVKQTQTTSGVKSFISGGIGGICLVLVGHPFDLLKVRLQTSSNPNATILSTARAAISETGLRGLYRGLSAPLLGVTPIFAVSFWGYATGQKLARALWDTSPTTHNQQPLSLTQICFAGGFSAIPTTLLMTPFERVKVLLQTTSSTGSGGGTMATIGRVWQNGGIRNFYTGTIATLLRDIPGSVAYFAAYEVTKRILCGTQNNNQQTPSTFAILTAGGMAGIAMWTVAIPADVLKSRLQAAPAGTYSGTLDVLRKLLKNESPRALFKGLGPALIRAYPANAACFLGVEASLKNPMQILSSSSASSSHKAAVSIEYISETPVELLQQLSEGNNSMADLNSNLNYYAKLFNYFAIKPSTDEDNVEEDQQSAYHGERSRKSGVEIETDSIYEDKAEEGSSGENVSKKKSRKHAKDLVKNAVAVLKLLAPKPDLIEWEDATAKDPLMLAALKAARNTVPVPPHWSAKRKYLQGKRGFVKPPFELPSFIRETGITELREGMLRKEATKNLARRAHDRLQPKASGKLAIDYSRLHDAFYKLQTKPPNMTRIGDLYYEGKEFKATKAASLQGKMQGPGAPLSEELRAALGMPSLVGNAAAAIAPLPWLAGMQKYGLPPAFPGISIPGVNAPIPEGAQWGYHPMGWGKPPVDEHNRPLWGDVFGTSTTRNGPNGESHERPENVPVQFFVEEIRKGWGELEVEEEEMEIDDENVEVAEVEETSEGDQVLLQRKEMSKTDEIATSEPGVSFISTLAVEDAVISNTFELRKSSLKSVDFSNEVKPLFEVLPEKKDGSIKGLTEHTYEIASNKEKEKKKDSKSSSSTATSKKKSTSSFKF